MRYPLTSRYEKNRNALEPPYRELVTQLDLAFSTATHDFWRGEDYHVAPSRREFAEDIRNKDLDDLSDLELNLLMFRVMTTMGGPDTLKFLLPRFYAAYFANPMFGWTSEPFVVKGKLERAGFDVWTEDQKTSALQALYVVPCEEFRLVNFQIF